MTLGVIFDSPRALHKGDKVFGGASGTDLCARTMEGLCDKVVVQSLAMGEDGTLLAIEALRDKVKSFGEVEAVLFCFSDSPFLSKTLSKKVLDAHKAYGADYTESLGFCEGVAPVALKPSLFGILAQLLNSNERYKKFATLPFTRGTLFSLLEVDINTYEIEDVISEEDFRLARAILDCHDKASTLSCKALYKLCEEKKLDMEKVSAEDLCRLAVNSEAVLKTVPSFYQIEIAGADGSFMKSEDFATIVQKIVDFSESAIVSLSVEGEPLQNKELLTMVKKLFEYKGLKLLIESGGELLSEELCAEIKKIVSQSAPRVGFDEYFEDVCWVLEGGKGAEVVAKYFPASVYAQYTRKAGDEVELEKFYRKWSDLNSPTGGRVTIRQNSTHCGTRREGKVVDLSPLQRRFCYHARRDFVVFTNGDVPYCEFCEKKIVGNILRDDIDKLFYVNKSSIIADDKVGGCCNECDEYYTFNF